MPLKRSGTHFFDIPKIGSIWVCPIFDSLSEMSIAKRRVTACLQTALYKEKESEKEAYPKTLKGRENIQCHEGFGCTQSIASRFHHPDTGNLSFHKRTDSKELATGIIPVKEVHRSPSASYKRQRRTIYFFFMATYWKSPK